MSRTDQRGLKLVARMEERYAQFCALDDQGIAHWEIARIIGVSEHTISRYSRSKRGGRPGVRPPGWKAQ